MQGIAKDNIRAQIVEVRFFHAGREFNVKQSTGHYSKE